MKTIPEVPEPDRYENCSFIDSDFVEILSNEYFDVKMQYSILKMEHAQKHCYVRAEVYDRLVEAAKNLPKGYRFRIWDAWRPFALQNELYIKYREDIIKEFHLESCSEVQQRDVIRKFVSEPVADKTVPPVHTTGGAIDLTIIDEKNQELEMGTAFDEFTEKTHTAFFEKETNEIVKENRRLLYWVMSQAGFTNLPSEWWHYDFGDRFWAFYCQKPAMYKGAFTKEEMNGKRGYIKEE